MSSQRKRKINFGLVKRIGLFLIALSFVGFSIISFPIISAELNYLLNRPNTDLKPLVWDINDESETIVAVSPDFSLIIPKIGVNVKVIRDVDPLDSKVYQVALSKGIAHAAGSALPGEGKNTFLFAHSSDSFINANRYNSVFYLLNKVEEGDLLYIVFEEKIYDFEVKAKEILDPENTELMKPDFGENTLVLMTCWPPGTTLKRLVVIGKTLD